MKKIIIAIDGYSSCGKSTVAKQLAKKLNYIFIDSGAMYRAITLFLMRHDLVDGTNAEIINALESITLNFEYNTTTEKSDILLNGENVETLIRSLDVSNNVSKIATIKEVRDLAVAQQRKIGENKGVVMDGRDIGTVVFPNAELKIFMTASIDVRVERRYKELVLSNPTISKEAVKENLESRDYTDSHRDISPLTQAADAKVLDNSALTMDAQLDIVLQWVESITK